MTDLLQQAFEKASKLSPEEQDFFASRLLAEMAGLAEDDDFDRKIEATAHKLEKMARAAREEYLRGETLPLDPKSL